jgi:hypothetical protein
MIRALLCRLLGHSSRVLLLVRPGHSVAVHCARCGTVLHRELVPAEADREMLERMWNASPR